MKIIQLNAENIKRLQAVEIRPNGNLVTISGRNKQGKTSILDAIWWALDTNKVIQSRPIRDGADRAFIRLDLGDYIVTKKFKAKADGDITISLTVENPDGAKFGSPNDLLNKFLGDLTFDPLAFSRMKPKDQVTALRALVPGYDFETAAMQNKKDYADRTEVNRCIRELGIRIDAITFPDDTPSEYVSVDAVMAELDAAMNHNTQVQNSINNRDKLQERTSHLTQAIEAKRKNIENLERRIQEERIEIEHTQDALAELDKEIAALGSIQEYMNPDPIKAKLSQAENINRGVAAKLERDKLLGDLARYEEESKQLTASIEARQASAIAAVRECKLPVTGLELTDDAVLLNGLPFEQASDAEQLRTSMAIAGAMNPQLRVIRVRDGSLLDDEAMQELETFAATNDLQIWIERVDSTGQVGVVIEDGMVVSSTEAAE